MLYSERSALIVGAGAVGAVLGSTLLRAGWHVTFRVRPEAFLGYRRTGLVVRENGVEFFIERERFICDAVARGSHRIVLLATKMPDFEQAIHGLAADDDGDRVYLTVQNGLAAPDMTAALFGRERVFAGAAIVNAYRPEHGVIEMQSSVRRLSIGALLSTSLPTAMDIAARFVMAGIQTAVADSSDQLLWEKFVGLEPLATASAMTRLALGDLRKQPSANKLLRGLFDETFEVANAAGARLDPEMRRTRWKAYLDGPPDMRPSLAVDLAQGRASELDWLTGTVVTLAEKTRVAAPLHRHAYQALLAALRGSSGA
jgi:2-dehydropantoate 2-reductase